MKKVIFLPLLVLILFLFTPSYNEDIRIRIKVVNGDTLKLKVHDGETLIFTEYNNDGSFVETKEFDIYTDSVLQIMNELVGSHTTITVLKRSTSLFPLARSQVNGPFAGLIQKGSNLNDYTTYDWKQVIVAFGDSKVADSYDTDQNSPAPTTGTSFQFDHITTGTIIPLTQTDLVGAGNAGANRGSPYPQFCITYNGLTGFKPVIVDGHVYGSYWSNATASLSWDTNGRLYENMRDRVYNALSQLKLVRPAAIQITLGINDNGSATTIGTVTANMQAIINRLAVDFPNTPVYVSMPGTDNNTPTARTGLIRSSITDLSINNVNVYQDLNENCLYSWGLMGADILHWLQAGNNKVGDIRAKFLYNSWSITDKDARRIVYNMYDAINSAKVTAISNFVVGDKADNNWYTRDALQIYRGDTENNILMDWVGRCGPLKPTNAFTFNANANIQTNGTNSYIRTWYAPSQLAKYATQNDSYFGVGILVNSTAAGTAARAFGAAAGNGIYLGQNASSQINFIHENATPQTYTGDNKLADNSDHLLQRTSSTAFEYIKNGTSVSTKSVSSTGFGSVFQDVGCTNNSNPDTPTSSSFLAATYTYYMSGQASTFNESASNSRMSTLLTALAIP